MPSLANPIYDPCLHSIMVRLRPLTEQFGMCGIGVYIPLWLDCGSDITFSIVEGDFVYIPLWLDCGNQVAPLSPGRDRFTFHYG